MTGSHKSTGDYHLYDFICKFKDKKKTRFSISYNDLTLQNGDLKNKYIYRSLANTSDEGVIIA